MADDLIPPTIPENGGGETPPEKQAGDKSADAQHKDVGSTDSHKGNKTEAVLFSALAFASAECFGVYFWEIADGSSGFYLFFFHWVSLCCLVAGIFCAAHQIIEDHKTRRRLWIWFIIPCVINAFATFAIWGPSRPTIANSHEPMIQTNVYCWFPPELPAGCSNVYTEFGTATVETPIWLAKIPGGTNLPFDFGTNYFSFPASSNLVFTVFHNLTNFANTDSNEIIYSLKDLPPGFVTNFEQFPDFSPRKRHISFNSRFVTPNVVLWKKVENPVWPFVVSNRLFVDVEIPFINQRHRILMDTNFEVALSNLPDKWDINYNSNKFEIVNEAMNPVLQVIYKSPNAVRVNGIYVFDRYYVYEAFDANPRLCIPVEIYNFPQSTQTFAIPIEALHNQFTNMIINVNTNGLFQDKYPNQKALFKYPSWQFYHVQAN